MVHILFPKLFRPTVRKKCSSDLEKPLKFKAELTRICKFFEITKTIYSNSERSDQFWKQNLFKLVPGVYHI